MKIGVSKMINYWLSTVCVYHKELLTALCGMALRSVVLAQSPLLLQPDTEKHLIKNCHYFIDNQHQFSANHFGKVYFENRFRPEVKTIPNYGYTDATVWLRFCVTSSRAGQWLLEADNCRLNLIRCYVVQNQKRITQQTLGDSLPFKAYQIPDRNPTFVLDFEANTTYTVYLQAHTTEDLKLPLTFWTPTALYAHLSRKNLLWGIYFGFILLIAAYNFLLWLTVRESIFVHYCLYVVCFGLFQFSLYGFGFQYVWDNAPFNDLAHVFFIGLLTLFFTYFSIQFLNIFQLFPRSKSFFKLVAWLWLMIYAGALYGYNHYTNVLIIGAGAVMIGLQQIYCLRLLFKRHKAAWLYFIATTALSISLIVVGMKNLDLLPADHQDYYLMAGSMLEITLFSLALGDRLRTAQREQARMLHVRNEIAANLHDDLAASLSSLTMYSELNRMRSQKHTPEMAEVFAKISARSREAMQLVREAVWEINPRNDQSEEWLDRLTQFAQETLDAQQVGLSLQIAPAWRQLQLPIDERRQVVLFFKEAINNIAKHARATHVKVAFKTQHTEWLITIEDDGVGFDTDHQRTGNGLRNFEERAKALRAQYQLQSAIGRGTSLTLRFKSKFG